MSTRKHTPDDKSTESSTATAEPPAAEAKPEGQSFAERVGKKARPSIPDPFGIFNDAVAGVRLFESKQDRQMAIKFEEKPSQAVIDKMKEAGYRWNPADRIWAYPLTSDSANTARVDADRLFNEVRAMIQQEKGIEAGPEVPF
jgi:hypothetical protein